MQMLYKERRINFGYGWIMEGFTEEEKPGRVLKDEEEFDRSTTWEQHLKLGLEQFVLLRPL